MSARPAVQEGRAIWRDKEKSIFTAQKDIDWHIYSFFM